LKTKAEKNLNSGSQTGATWLTTGGIFNSWEEICSRSWEGKAVDDETLSFYYFFIQHIKNCTSRLV